MTIKEFTKYLSGLPEELQKLPLYVYVDELVGDGLPLFAKAVCVRPCFGRNYSGNRNKLCVGAELAYDPTPVEESLTILKDSLTEKERLESGAKETEKALRQPAYPLSIRWHARNNVAADRVVCDADLPFNTSCNRPARVHEVVRTLLNGIASTAFPGTSVVLCDVDSKYEVDGRLDMAAVLREDRCSHTFGKVLSNFHPYLNHEVAKVTRLVSTGFPWLKTYIVCIRPNEPVLQPTNKE